MKKQNKLTALALVGFTILAFASCNKDEDIIQQPTIEGLEVGHDNNQTAYPGSDLHLDAEILAPGTIASIKLEIHPEAGEGWTFEKVYTTGYAGVKNADFHEHIDVPDDAAVGEYHLHLVVTDNAGNTAEAESHLEIVVDPTLPSIAGFEVEFEAAKGELHVEGDITAKHEIAEISVEVHGGDYEKEFEVDGDYVGKTEFHLHKHFDISDAPAGHYHVHLRIKDQANKEREFEGHFDK